MLGPIPRCACLPLRAIDKAVLHVIAKRAHWQICKYAKLAERVLSWEVWHIVYFIHFLRTVIVYLLLKGMQIFYSSQLSWGKTTLTRTWSKSDDLR